MCWSGEPTSPPLSLCTETINASVLAIAPQPDKNAGANKNAANVVESKCFLADDLGNVYRISLGANTEIAVQPFFQSGCSIAAFAFLPDRTGDGIPELLAGGAEQVLYLRDGRTGAEIWTRDLADLGGYGYIHRIFNAGDLNNNGSSDAVILDWNGDVVAYDGNDGAQIWKKSVTSGFTEALDSMGDMNSDGLPEFAAGGNNSRVRMVSGANGSTLWDCFLDRPVRAVCAVADVNDDATTDCFAATAGGRVACISGAGSGSVSPLWTAEVGDVCRALACPGDLDGDGRTDVAVCAENGVVAAFSGATGALLWQWNGPDVIRSLIAAGDADDDGYGDLVAGALDGTVALLPGNPAVWNRDGSAPVFAAPPPFDKLAPLVSAQTACKGKILGRDAQATRPLGQNAQATGKTNSAVQEGAKPVLDARPDKAAAAESIPILLYHDIIPVIKYPYGASAANFQAQMDLLVEGGYTTVSLDEIADWIEGKIELPDKSICITFDGPYDGQYTHAYHILKERGLSAVVYCTTDWIGTANHADWHQLREMDSSGVQHIENHTINHPSLSSQTRQGVIDQIQLCNQSIQRHCNGKIARHHAYPGGSYSSTVMSILAELGVRTATTVESRAATRSDQLLALPRRSVTINTSLASFRTLIGYVAPMPKALPYRFAGTVGSGWKMPSYGDLDAAGRLWICDYSANNVRVFEPGGAEAAFSPITQGRTSAGAAKAIRAPSGIVVTPDQKAIVTIADYTSNPTCLALFIYNAIDGQALPGKELAYRPGDADCDAAGHVFVVDKVTDSWHVYDSSLNELAGSPFGPATTSHIQRGLSVRPDGARVYVASEADGMVHAWEGSIDAEGAHYTQIDNLVEGLGGASGGVDVADDGTIYVGEDALGRLLAFDAQHKLIGALWGGSPTLTTPRGAVISPDSGGGGANTIWIISRSAFVQRWKRYLPSAFVLY